MTNQDIEDIKKANIDQHTTKSAWLKYYERAEPHIDEQWNTFIWPLISDADFTTTIDLATGAGRNAKKLIPLAQKIYLAHNVR